MGMSYQLVFYSDEDMEKVLKDFLDFASSAEPVTSRVLQENLTVFESAIYGVPIVAHKFDTVFDALTAILHNVTIRFLKPSGQLDEIIELCIRFLHHHKLAGIFQVDYDDEMLFAYKNRSIIDPGEKISDSFEELATSLDLQYIQI